MTPDEVQRLLRERAICVIIPTYNNAATIRSVVSAAADYCSAVIVVDDGSSDDPASLLHDISSITLLRNPRNRGKGYALKRAFRYAREQGYAYAITLDGDGQHYPADIPRFLAANCQHPGALIVGCRALAGKERSRGSRFANSFSNLWFTIQTGKRVADTQSGYRLYPLKKLHALAAVTDRYEAEVALLVLAAWHGVPIISLPIDVYYPPAAQRVSHFRPCRDFLRISLLNTVLCVAAVLYGLPLRIARAVLTAGRTIYSLLTFLVVSLLIIPPLLWIYERTHKSAQQVAQFAHTIIYRVARFVVLQHGIPGAPFSATIAEGTTFSRPHIIICNHQSHLDLFCLLVLTPRIVFITKEWVWHNPFYGHLIRAAEYLPAGDGIEVLLPQMRALVQRGYSIALFPEGTRSATGEIGRFHQGACYLAQQLQLDILPMVLYGTGRVLPLHAWYLRRYRLHLFVEHAWPRAQLDSLGDIRPQTAALHRWYLLRYSQIKNKLEQDV